MSKFSDPLRFVHALVCAVSFAAATGPALAYTGEEFAKQAKVTMSEAESIAPKARPGKITNEELESEGGGSSLRYSFDIKSGGKTYEIGVDAMTGVVLENAAEGHNPD